LSHFFEEHTAYIGSDVSQFPGAYDPTDQTEDLGNDHFRAGEMAVSNLKIIMKNFEKWLFDEGKANVGISSFGVFASGMRRYPQLIA